MYVEKIEIPAFRALRDVVLEFSGGHDPQVFPLGSKNGGGKSTLLQLVFVLLHCSSSPDNYKYLRNLLATDSYPGSEPQRTMARFTVRLDGETKVLEFLSLSYQFLAEKLPEPPEYGFGTATRKNLVGAKSPQAQEQQKALSADLERIQHLMAALDYAYITAYRRSNPAGEQWHALVCRVPGHSADEVWSTLAAIREKVFLIGPSNQQYIFLDAQTRKALLAPRAVEDDSERYDPDGLPPDAPQVRYVKALAKAEADMRGFYAYDWLSVEPLLQLFRRAKDEDFEAMVRTGAYGERYKTILTEVNDLLVGKKVRPLPDLTGVEFLIEEAQGSEIALRPEDLSHGELKRLLMFAWLRANNAADALVLIDEIETSFHPDWQVGIVRDLQEWGPQNQYILATHSYELCQALTPRHVRELSPRLAKGEGAPEGTRALG